VVLACLEVSPFSTESQLSRDTNPPLSLLSLAAAGRDAGIDVHLIPAGHWEAVEEAKNEIAGSDAIAVWLDSFNWPGARDILRRLRRTGQTVLAIGPHAELFSSQVLATGLVDRVLISYDWVEDLKRIAVDAELCGVEHVMRGTAWHNLRLPNAHVVMRWPRWDLGFCNQETFGFPLANQPHPWNTPLLPRRTLAETAEWLRSMVSTVGILRRPLLWLGSALESWDRETMDMLGDFTLAVLREQGTAPLFCVRITPGEALEQSVLPSLSLLQVEKIDLLVGAGHDAALGRLGARFAVKEIQRASAELHKLRLADKTTLCCVVGLPGETSAEACETVRFAVHVAAVHRIPQVRCEWWYNVPGSPYYQSSIKWEEDLLGGQTGWFDDPRSPTMLPSAFGLGDRQKVLEMTELLRIFNPSIRITGLTPIEGAGSERAGPSSSS
jgi:hypothetical protein